MNNLEYINELIKNNKLKEANIEVDKILSNDPYNETAWIYKGILFQKAQLYDKAKECFEKAISINPYSFETQFNLAIFYRDYGFGDWLSHYNRAYQLEPNNPKLTQDLELYFKALLKQSYDIKSFENIKNFFMRFDKNNSIKLLLKELDNIVDKYKKLEKIKFGLFIREDSEFKFENLVGIIVLFIIFGLFLLWAFIGFILILSLFSPLLLIPLYFQEKKLQKLLKEYENYLWIGAIAELFKKKIDIHEFDKKFIRTLIIIFANILAFAIIIMFFLFISRSY